jgi:thymidylate synthase
MGRTFEAKGRTFEAKGRTFEAKGRTFEAKGRTFEAKGRTFEAMGRTFEAMGQTFEAKGRTYSMNQGNSEDLWLWHGVRLLAQQTERRRFHAIAIMLARMPADSPTPCTQQKSLRVVLFATVVG